MDITRREPGPSKADADLLARLATESQIASEGGAFQKGIMQWGALTPFTCPECHGALVTITEGGTSRFRCHTGHAYTDSALLDGIAEATAQMLWQVLRSMEEGVMLLRHMGKHLEDAGAVNRAKPFFAKAQELEARSKIYGQDAFLQESLSGDNTGQ